MYANGGPSELIAWVDIETTGLNPHSDMVLEVGIVITDNNLQVVDLIDRLIYQGKFFCQSMDAVVKKMHSDRSLGGSGLIDDVLRNATLERSEMRLVELDLTAFMQHYFPKCLEDDLKGKPAMAGSSVHFDRSFLKEDFPTLHKCFHYRNIDVSSVKELVRRFKPRVLEALPKPRREHRTLPDIHDTIAEMAVYKEHLFGITNPLEEWD